jgi:hypothetical protein
MKLVRIAGVGVSLTAVVVISAYAYKAGGSGGHATDRYAGVFRDGKVEVIFEVKLDPLSFLLNRIKNKYKLIQIFVKSSGRGIKLSAENDKIELQFRNERGEEVLVRGIVNPGVSDPNFWDSLDNKLRRTLAYPKSIMPNAPEVICVLIPAAKVEAVREPEQEIDILPALIRYKIADLADGPVDIGRYVLEAAPPGRSTDL